MAEDRIELAAVVTRFRAAESTIDKLSDRLRELSLAEDWAQRGAESMDQSARTLDQVAGSLREAVSHLQTTLPELRSAVELADRFLAQIDVNGFAAEVARANSLTEANGAAVASLRTDLESLGSAVARSLDTLSQRVVAMDQGRAEAASARDAHRRLVDRINAIPERQRKKYGLDAAGDASAVFEA